ncbi:BrnT family toxin [Pseudorhodoplanes sp.]|uniref:BrnT family toxin n=1 Tax=Pseudorhodoplanes sp. TaxID=1934341 RepID=UPI00391D54EA
MKIVWDKPKRIANLEKHRLDFRDLTEAFFADALIIPARDKRWRGIGPNANGVICVVFARYGRAAISVISMRPARNDERRLYAEALKD